MRSQPVFLLVLLLTLTARTLPAQTVEEEERVLAAALSHAMQTRGDRMRGRVVLDPAILEEGWRSGPEDWDRARRVAGLVGVQVATERSVTSCSVVRRGGCHLVVGDVFRLGSPRIDGDRARVWVLRRWAEPELRDPMPMASFELILERITDGWRVAGKRPGFIS